MNTLARIKTMTARYLNVIPSTPKKPPALSPIPSEADLDITNYMVYFDFDNTITPFDVLDSVIERFSINRDWMIFEEAWIKGRIGSKECLEGQLRSVRATKKALSAYLSTVPVDPYFTKLLSLFKKMGVSPAIVSDSFSFLIRFILKNNGISGLRIYSNILKFYKDRLIPSFPYTNSLCSHCAHCKTSNLTNEVHREKKIIYIGDGLSDVCPAHYADIVFAKSTLLKHFRETQRQCLSFNNFEDIYNYLKEYRNESHPKVMRTIVSA
jgi:2,3-diketo-5-methylthio-1-phosphopentane phosphatase